MEELGRTEIWALRAAGAALAVATLLLLSPGLLGPDEADMLRQAEAGSFHDWHSPLIAWLWSLGLKIWPGTGSIHALITLCYFLGFGLVAEGALRRRHRLAGWVIVALSIFPLTWIALAAAGSKDVFTSALLLISVGMIARWPERPRLAACLALVPLLLVMEVRPNAVFPAAPIVALIAWGLTAGTRPRLRTVVTAGIAILSIPALLFSTVQIRSALGIERSHLVAGLFLYDLAGIAAVTGRDASAGLLGREFGDKAAGCYTPLHWDTYSLWGKCPEAWLSLFRDSLFGTAEEERGLRDAWLAAIFREPGAYASHRLKHFASEIGLGEAPLGEMSWVEVPLLNPRLLAPLAGVATALAGFPLFQPYVVLLLGGLGLALTARRRSLATAVAATLFASGLTYGLAYLLVGVASNLRYFHWPLVAVLSGYAWLAASSARVISPVRQP